MPIGELSLIHRVTRRVDDWPRLYPAKPLSRGNRISRGAPFKLRLGGDFRSSEFEQLEKSRPSPADAGGWPSH